MKFDPSTVQRPMSVEMVKNKDLSDDDDDADVLIESEEIQQVNTAKSKKPSGSVQNDEQEKQSPWPIYKQNNVGFAAANVPFPNHRAGPNSKQPRLTSNATIDKHPDVADIIKHIEQNHLILICMRGAPGR